LIHSGAPLRPRTARARGLGDCAKSPDHRSSSLLAICKHGASVRLQHLLRCRRRAHDPTRFLVTQLAAATPLLDAWVEPNDQAPQTSSSTRPPMNCTHRSCSTTRRSRRARVSRTSSTACAPLEYRNNGRSSPRSLPRHRVTAGAHCYAGARPILNSCQEGSLRLSVSFRRRATAGGLPGPYELEKCRAPPRQQRAEASQIPANAVVPDDVSGVPEKVLAGDQSLDHGQPLLGVATAWGVPAAYFAQSTRHRLRPIGRAISHDACAGRRNLRAPR